MNNLRQAAQQALEFCEFLWREVLLNDWAEMQREAVEQALRAALNLPEQEPVAWMWKDGTVTDDPDRADGTWTPPYTAPTPRKPLTDLEILAANKFMYNQHTCVYIQEDGEPENLIAFARAIERAHGIKE